VACLEARPSEPAAYVVELDVREDRDDEPAVPVGVDAIGRTEELLLRPVGPLVASLGPFAGALVRADGSLALALDPYAIAPRARAIGRMTFDSRP
jgi:chemotaxis protein histidine kinase CheA